MIRPTQEHLEAFSRLRNSPVQKYLQSALQECQEQLVTQTDVDLLRRLQGQAQAFQHLLKHIG